MKDFTSADSKFPSNPTAIPRITADRINVREMFSLRNFVNLHTRNILNTLIKKGHTFL